MYSAASGGMSCSTTQKHRHFVSEPMREKLVTELPGIGLVPGRNLSEAGFPKARNVLGQYLMLDGDENRFVNWLKGICSANSKQAGDCYMGLRTWCDNHM